MKKSVIILFVLFLWSYGGGLIQQPVGDNWENMIEIENATLQRHALTDLPGTIVVIIPREGKFIVRLLPRKVILNNDNLPKIEPEPTQLVSSSCAKSIAMGIGFLSFVSTSMNNTDVVKYNVTETCYSQVFDKDIDWAAFEKRVQEIKEKNPDLPAGTRFGVVKIADIIVINYEIYEKKDKAVKISGWGFNQSGKVLSEKQNMAQEFKIGVALVYSDYILDNFELRSYIEENKLKVIPYMLQSSDNSKNLNILVAQNLIEPGRIIEDIENIKNSF